uniref:Ribonuclease H-like domain-containing protein n=1 Tax=Tanacetum cinerariifolium TaxID=118510 RepID=A0A6L2P1C4_TANCI|nr:ribonuclease H-like domain-containing protein [Tanacetum cinerariifolium]
MALKAELRNLKLGDLSIDGYFQKIESIVSVLNGLGSPLSNDDVVTFALEGLPFTYETISTVIVSQEHFPDLKTVRSLLTTHEMRLNARRGPSLEKVNNPCRNFAKGSCRFGDACKYLHNGVHGKSTLLPRTSGLASSVPDVTRSDLDMLQSMLAKFGLDAPNTSTPSPSVAYMVYVPPGGSIIHSRGSDAFWSTAGGSPCTWTFIAASSVYDRGSTAARGFFPCDILNMCIYPSVAVGDGRFIPVTNSGHSVLSTPFCPLRLITRRVLLRCDSTGDLYPVTKPFTIPHAFLTSQYTWHQRLGHPRSKVLRHLVSSDSISCNKEKLPVLCHASQFKCEIKSFQCDHGGEFDNHAFHKLFHDNDTNHKLGPRVTLSIFLGHAANHFDYHCLDLNTNKIIISRHVTFDETVFSFPSTKSTTTPSYDILYDSTDLMSIIIRTAPITPVPAPVHTPQVDSVPQIVPEHAPASTNDSPTVSIHPMVTRSRVGTTRPNPRYAGHVSTSSPLPRSYKEAFNDPNWRNAMFDGYDALIKSKTWTSVPRPEGANIVRSDGAVWFCGFKHEEETENNTEEDEPSDDEEITCVEMGEGIFECI